MISQGNEVILIEKNPNLAKELAESLDCTVMHGEGTQPNILEKAEIKQADALVACTTHDQDNILIGLIAKETEVSNIIVKVDDVQFTEAAKKLGLSYIINPSHIASTFMYDVLRGVDTIELSNLIRANVRFTSVYIDSNLRGKKISELELPEKSAFIGLYRKSEFILADKDPKLEENDELMVVTTSEYINEINNYLTGKTE